MNRDAYNEAWANLLAARQSGTLEDVRLRLAEMTHEVRLLLMERKSEQQEACNHFLVLNGYCCECGYNKRLDTASDS